MGKKVYRVKKGDDFFKISEKLYGDASYAMALIRANPGFDYVGPGMVLRLPKEDPRITRQRKMKRREKLYGSQTTTQSQPDLSQYESMLGKMENPEQLLENDYETALSQDIEDYDSGAELSQDDELPDWLADPKNQERWADAFVDTALRMGLDVDAMMEEWGVSGEEPEPQTQPPQSLTQPPQMAGDEEGDLAEPDQSGMKYPEPGPPPQPDETAGDDTSADVSDLPAGETEDDGEGAPKVLERPVVEEEPPEKTLREVEDMDDLTAWSAYWFDEGRMKSFTEKERDRLEKMFLEKRNELRREERMGGKTGREKMPTIHPTIYNFNQTYPDIQLADSFYYEGKEEERILIAETINQFADYFGSPEAFRSYTGINQLGRLSIENSPETAWYNMRTPGGGYINIAPNLLNGVSNLDCCQEPLDITDPAMGYSQDVQAILDDAYGDKAQQVIYRWSFGHEIAESMLKVLGESEDKSVIIKDFKSKYGDKDNYITQRVKENTEYDTFRQIFCDAFSAYLFFPELTDDYDRFFKVNLPSLLQKVPAATPTP